MKLQKKMKLMPVEFIISCEADFFFTRFRLYINGPLDFLSARVSFRRCKINFAPAFFKVCLPHGAPRLFAALQIVNTKNNAVRHIRQKDRTRCALLPQIPRRYRLFAYRVPQKSIHSGING